MYTGTRAYSSAAELPPFNPPPEIRESFSNRRQPVPLGHGLAGSDLNALWDPARFVRDCIPYGSAFMKRMHHPFHEVLACLYLNNEHAAIAYNSYFRGEKATALAHLPTVLHTAHQLGAVRLLLAHNPSWDADSKLPVLALVYQQMQAAGVELHDFLLIRNDSTLSMRTHGGL